MGFNYFCTFMYDDKLLRRGMCYARHNGEGKINGGILRILYLKNNGVLENRKSQQIVYEKVLIEEHLKEEIERIEQDRDDNYKPIPKNVQYDVYDNMFI